jgi:hypothetical protein
MASDILKQIKTINSNISSLTTNIKSNITRLEKLITEEKLLLDISKEHNTEYCSTLAKTLNTTPIAVKNIHKNQAYIVKRGIHSRKSYELLGILPQPVRSKNKSTQKPKNNLMVFGGLVANVRAGAEARSYSSAEKEIMLSMLEAVKAEVLS